MEIKDFENYNLKLQKMKQLSKQIQIQAESKSDNSQDGPSSRQKISSNLSNIIPSINKNLDKSLQTLLLKTWVEMTLPLEEKYISKLINYINLKNDINPELLIKSFAFLIKNKLPLIRELIEGIASNLNSSNSLSELLVSTSSGENPTENDTLPAEIKNRLTFKLNQPPAEIAQKLKNYPEELKQTISLLKNGQKGSKKLLHHLLGQQSLNLPEAKQKNNLLLALELPVIFRENDDPLPLQLQVKRCNKKTKEKSNNKTSFQISFIIDLEKKGPVKADIIIQSNHIQCKFITLSSHTAKIIEATFPLLKERLETLKFQVEDPVINQVKNEKKFNNTEPYSESSIPGRKKKNDTQPGENFIHFDFKV